MTTGIGLRSDRGPVLLAVMVSTGLIAIDSTVLATAVPTIVKDLGGFAEFPWLFSVYLLAQAVTVPVYAKLADTLGRKPLILVGIGIFLLGSVLCGFAWSMPALIAFRAVQGLGAGAIQPMTVTITGDIYTVAERARVQGYIASVWAVASVVGPTIGGVFAQLDAWRWIFFVNIPGCLLAAVLIVRNFHEEVVPRRHRIDIEGGVLLTVAMSLVIVGVLEGGQAWAWSSPTSIGVLGGGAVLLVAFALVERRAAEPVLPAMVVRRRLLLTTSLTALGVGAIVIGLTSYVPTYLEGSIGTAPIVAGLALAVLSIGWPLSSSLSGRLYMRVGFRPTVLSGTVVALAGVSALVLTAHTPRVAVVAACAFVTGLGMGLMAAPSLIAAQSSVGWGERGVVTGTNLFARAIGSALGVAVFGAVANSVVGTTGMNDPHRVTQAGHAVFVAVLVATVLTGLAALAMPKVRAESFIDR